MAPSGRLCVLGEESKNVLHDTGDQPVYRVSLAIVKFLSTRLVPPGRCRKPTRHRPSDEGKNPKNTTYFSAQLMSRTSKGQGQPKRPWAKYLQTKQALRYPTQTASFWKRGQKKVKTNPKTPAERPFKTSRTLTNPSFGTASSIIWHITLEKSINKQLSVQTETLYAVLSLHRANWLAGCTQCTISKPSSFCPPTVLVVSLPPHTALRPSQCTQWTY